MENSPIIPVGTYVKTRTKYGGGHVLASWWSSQEGEMKYVIAFDHLLPSLLGGKCELILLESEIHIRS